MAEQDWGHGFESHHRNIILFDAFLIFKHGKNISNMFLTINYSNLQKMKFIFRKNHSILSCSFAQFFIKNVCKPPSRGSTRHPCIILCEIVELFTGLLQNLSFSALAPCKQRSTSSRSHCSGGNWDMFPHFMYSENELKIMYFVWWKVP